MLCRHSIVMSLNDRPEEAEVGVIDGAGRLEVVDVGLVDAVAVNEAIVSLLANVVRRR